MPQPRHGGDVGFFDLVHPGRAIDQPGDRGGVAQIGGQLAVGVIEEVPLAGEAAYLGGQGGVVDQILVPDILVRVWLNLINTQSMAPSLFEVKAEL
ncbi:hypothetical protein [Microbulbifer donghaiensis]|uniref:hypothetical protein n=1 Tax=Microbulbifer donghaiensis TaxID=494016 RepID=UPI001F32C61B|nr:hypothetical protein [Microbulbifer donghaiensis]